MLLKTRANVETLRKRTMSVKYACRIPPDDGNRRTASNTKATLGPRWWVVTQPG
jgi:hypothetical protein